MDKVLIAYDNDSTTVLHDFLELCADEAKQICLDNKIGFSSVCPPNLNEQNVIGNMLNHQLCLIAGHGDADGIYNENGDAIVSIYTTNYNFKNKGFYTIACSCAKSLHPHLMSQELLFLLGIMIHLM